MDIASTYDRLLISNQGNEIPVIIIRIIFGRRKTEFIEPSVFSDDIKLCAKEIDIPDNSYFIDWNTGCDSYLDMQLMSQCKHNIIANSSFSWWAAWLNVNENKIVIAPNIWFNGARMDINNRLLPDWIRIKNL
jgi:hypothetical protein